MSAQREFGILNGKRITASEHAFPFSNRAFMYGDGLFETMHWHRDRILFLEDHLQRLYRGLEALAISLPAGFSPERLEKESRSLLSACRIAGDARLRLQIWREPEGLSFKRSSVQSSYILTVNSLPVTGFKLNVKGLRVGIVPGNLLFPSPFSSFKSCNRIPYVMAGIYAARNGLDDAILLNHRGQVSESAISNIFIFNGGEWLTPSLRSGCVDGVMRKNLLRMMKLLKYPVREKIISVQDLEEAEEVFFSNVIRGISRVEAVEGKRKTTARTAQLAGKLFGKPGSTG